MRGSAVEAQFKTHYSQWHHSRAIVAQREHVLSRATEAANETVQSAKQTDRDERKKKNTPADAEELHSPTGDQQLCLDSCQGGSPGDGRGGGPGSRSCQKGTGLLLRVASRCAVRPFASSGSHSLTTSSAPFRAPFSSNIPSSPTLDLPMSQSLDTPDGPSDCSSGARPERSLKGSRSVSMAHPVGAATRHSGGLARLVCSDWRTLQDPERLCHLW